MSQEKNLSNFDLKTVKTEIHSIDESLYSRQLYVLGKDAMERMAKSSVLISSLGGLGVEVAKNIILGGVKSVTLHDFKSVQWSDLSTNFYLNEKDIGKNRVDRQINYLRELNPNVQLFVNTNKIVSLDYYLKFEVVVLTEGFQTCQNVLEISDFCHENGICFIMCETRGLFSRSFCDFGKDFVVQDPFGEESGPLLVKEIVRENGSIVFTTAQNHLLRKGDSLKILYKNFDSKFLDNIETINATKFSISTSSCELPDDLNTLHVQKVKRPQNVSFEKLTVSLEEPKFIIPDYGKINNPLQVHCLFRALDDFVGNNGHFPRPRNNQDFQEIYKSANLFLEKLSNQVKIEKIDENLARGFSFGCRGQLCPMTAFIGGFIGQEVMKGCSGKLMPLKQWMFYDSIECLPPSILNSDLDDCEFISESRYEGQVAVFGRAFQEVLDNAKFFVVGAGAIGCELLKNFALMGIGCGSQGKITVTDMDSIEKSNLNRQFLFRNKDVGKMKSVTAAQAIGHINPCVNIESHCFKVGKETEGTFDAQFFENLNGIATAVDNLNARMYMDEMSLLYLKPLLESGTHGTKGNTQVIFPGLTKNYGSTTDPSTVEIPMCTLKYFPSAIQHTIQWGRELFEEMFKTSAENVKHFIQGTSIWSQGNDDIKIEDQLSLLEQMKMFLETFPSNYSDCVTWSFHQFDNLFNQEIHQLLKLYPRDSVNLDGQEFWSGGKLCPNPINFDFNDSNCVDFIFCASNLKAKLHGIPQQRNFEIVKQFCSELKNIPPVSIVPKAEGLEVSNEQIEAAVEIIRRMDNFKRVEENPAKYLEPLEFEKDDDTNLHIDFITASSNLRAQNYGIPQENRLNVKKIAGRIIPAIATTTSVVAGLVCLELYKVMWMEKEGHQIKSPFKDCFLNLALPQMTFGFSSKPKELTYNNKNYNVWSRFQVNGSKTLRELIEWMNKEHNLDVSSISYDDFSLYSLYFGEEENEPFMDLSIQEVASRISNKEIGESVKSLLLTLRCSNVGESDVPPIIYKFR